MHYKPVTIAYGDGIGPEITEGVIKILKEAEANIRLETIEVGEALYKKGYTSGIAEETWDSIYRTGVLLKGPITTPQGGGYKSLNVTLRKTLGLFANIRPVVSYEPFIPSDKNGINLTIVRENEEDLYAGIEYRQTSDAYKAIKLITRRGSDRIIKFAFEYAIKNGYKKVTCMSKDNIMKFADGIFHKTFNSIAKNYSDLEIDHQIIDIGTARIATTPETFGVIVTSNLYGDIISDVAAECSGSVGIAPSANIGTKYSMFEAIHGSAPKIANQDTANPSGLLNAAVMMLVHIGENKAASVIENAWKKTIEEGIHTKDIYSEQFSSKKVGTKDFVNNVIKRLGQIPKTIRPASYEKETSVTNKEKHDDHSYVVDSTPKKLVGIDVFIDITAESALTIVEKIKNITNTKLKLHTVSAKGLKLWPSHRDTKINSDHWCCRFIAENNDVEYTDIIHLLRSFHEAKINFISTENLYKFGDELGYSLAQGE